MFKKGFLWNSKSLDQYVKLLLHFDGTDGSINIIDMIGKTMTAIGNAQLDTAQKIFGTASLLLDGTGDKITTPSHSDFNLSNGDFTFDFRVRTNTIANYDTFFSKYCTGTLPGANNWYKFDMGVVSGNTVKFRFYAVNYNATYVAGYETTNAVTLNDGNWHHIALVRNGTNIYIFLDGVSLAQTVTYAIGTTALGDTNDVFNIGDDQNNTPRFFDGWIDEFRFSKGIARWTANFTPPFSAY